MNTRVVLVVLTLCLLYPSSLAATIQWTGAAGNSLWNFANNWLGNAVPTANDDVVINVLGGSSVSISQPAVANSVTIAGGSYPQTLTLLSQLTVGAGGIKVLNGGTLQVQSNNNLPLASSGAVTISAGASFVFQSGAISGPGIYTVNVGATLTFSQSALKLISNANLINNGHGTVQASTIQIEKSGTFINNGNLTLVGSVNIFNTDNSASAFSNYGGFSYQGGSGATLNLQIATNFYSLLDIESGSVSLAGAFSSNSTINLPSGSTLTISAGTSTKSFNVIKGNGELSVEGNAIFNSPVSLSAVVVTDSGKLTLNSAASFAGASFAGVVIVQTSLSITNLTLAGGNLQGPGTTTVSSYLWINPSDTGNNNNFLSSTLILYGQGQTTSPIYFLLGSGGKFQIGASGTFNILSSFNLGIQAGKPLFVIDGTVSVTLTSSQTFVANTDISGNGNLKINSGTITTTGDTFTIGSLFLAVGVTASLNTVVLTAGSVTGAGSLNLTAAPSPVSTISNAAITYLGIVNGVVNIGTFAVSTFNVWSGTVTLASGSTNTATTANFYGGSLSGAAKVTSSALNLILRLPVAISGITWKTTSLAIQEVGNGSIQLSNGATIVADSSIAAPSAVRSGVKLN